MSTFHSGRKGTVTVNGVELPVIRWNVNAPAQIVEFKNSKTGRVPARESTFLDLSGTVVIDLDFDANPFGSVQAGAEIQQLKLFAYGTTDTGNSWTIPYAVVTDTPMEVVVEGKVGISFNWAVNNKNGTSGNAWTGPNGYTPSSVA